MNFAKMKSDSNFNKKQYRIFKANLQKNDTICGIKFL